MLPLNCGHLFNGIGGFALAAHWMNWTNVMHCEIDPFCNKVMNYHFPNSYQHEDIRTTDFTIWRGKLDLITGGFPCQPYSTAGKRKGKDDDRHLWPQMLRAVREIQPGWIVGENVRGLTNWNGGLVFDEVQADLETEGYEVLPFLLPAAGVGCDHLRERVWFIAYNKCFGGWKEGKGRLDMEERVLQKRKREKGTIRYSTHPFPSWYEVASTLCQPFHGISGGLVDETIYGWESKGLHAVGNAVVPQIVYQIFKAIEQWQLSQE